MKIRVCLLVIVLAETCLGERSTEASEYTDASGSFLKIDRDIPIIAPEKARYRRSSINLDRPINSLEQRHFVCFLSDHSSAYRRGAPGGLYNPPLLPATPPLFLNSHAPEEKKSRPPNPPPPHPPPLPPPLRPL